MTENQNPQWTTSNYPAPAKSRTSKIAAGVAAVVVGLFFLGCIGVGVSAIVGSSGDTGRTAVAPAPESVPDPGVRPSPAPEPQPGPSPTQVATRLAAETEVTVKVTDKQCFGSAVCNIEFDVKAGWPADAVPAGTECAVTYEIRGATDPQTGTLTIKDDGTYQADSFNFAQTSKKSAKLSAKVTEVECTR